MFFFDNIIDVDAILENFTEEQLEIIFNEEMDASVCDDDYLTLPVLLLSKKDRPKNYLDRFYSYKRCVCI